MDFYHASEHLKLLAEALEPTRLAPASAERADPLKVRSLLEHGQQCLKEDRFDQAWNRLHSTLALPA